MSPTEVFLGARFKLEIWSSMFANRAFAKRLPTTIALSRSDDGSFASFASVSLMNLTTVLTFRIAMDLSARLAARRVRTEEEV
jgi:hypothetical protein